MKLGKAGTDQGRGQLALRGAVQGGDQRRQLLLLHVLQLVDEQRQRGLSVSGGLAPRTR